MAQQDKLQHDKPQQDRIENPRAIVDRRALAAEVETVAKLPDAERRTRLLGLLKQALKAGREEIRRRFEANNIGGEVVHAKCHLVDQLVRSRRLNLPAGHNTPRRVL